MPKEMRRTVYKETKEQPMPNHLAETVTDEKDRATLDEMVQEAALP